MPLGLLPFWLDIHDPEELVVHVLELAQLSPKLFRQSPSFSSSDPFPSVNALLGVFVFDVGMEWSKLESLYLRLGLSEFFRGKLKLSFWTGF